MDEMSWEAGHRAALVDVIRSALRGLGYDDRTTGVKLVVQREEAIAMLRNVCEQHGDNDWPDDLHLADIIDKHLLRHLGQ